MKGKKFSIVTPSFNQGKYIRDTIESVLAQSVDFEHIIIDGGSDDETIQILKEYPHLIWISEKDSGPASAINKGFELANGEIYSWLNSDDYYDNDVLQVVENSFIDPECRLLFGNLTFVDKDKNKIYSDKTVRFDKEYLINVSADVIRQPCSFFSKDLFEDTGKVDESLKLVFDYDLFIRMLEKTNPCFIDRNLAFYREYPQTLTQNNLRKQAMELFKVSRKYGGNLMSRLNYTNLKKVIFSSV